MRSVGGHSERLVQVLAVVAVVVLVVSVVSVVELNAVTTSGVSSSGSASTAPPPSDSGPAERDGPASVNEESSGPIDVELEWVDGPPGRNTSATVRVTLTARESIADESVQVVTPSGIERVSGSFERGITLSEGESTTFTATVRPVRDGRFTVEVRTSDLLPDDEGVLRVDDHLSFTVGTDVKPERDEEGNVPESAEKRASPDERNATTDEPNGSTDDPDGSTDEPNGSTDEPNGSAVEVRAGGETTNVATAHGENGSVAASYNAIVISGDFDFYDDRHGAYKGAWGAEVQVWDADTWSGDDHVETVYLQKDGSLDVTISETQIDNNEGDDTLELYLQIYPRNGNVQVQHPDGTYSYWRIPSSGTQSVSKGGSWSPYYTATSGEGYLHILRTLMDGWHYVYGQTGETLGQVTARWDDSTYSGSAYSCSSNVIEVEHDDQWDHDTLLHEYGHHVMCDVYGYTLPTQNFHNPQTNTDEPTAWAEGWATYFSASVQGDTTHEDYNDDGSLEKRFDVESGSICSGTDCEGTVIKALWDVEDGNADGESDGVDVTVWLQDDVDRSFLDVWQAFADPQSTESFSGSGSHVDSIDEFRENWYESNSNEGRMVELFYLDELDYNDPPGGTLDGPTGGGWYTDPVTYAASPSDPEGEVLKVQFYYDRGGGYQYIDTVYSSDGWSLAWNPSFTDDSVTARAVVVDNVGETAADGSGTFGVDTSAPNAPSPDDGVSGYTSDDSPTFSWSNPGDAGSGVDGYYYELDDSTPDNEYTSASSTSRSYSGLSDGEHTFYVQAYDGVGQTSAVGSHSIKIDTVPPDTDATHSHQTWSDDDTVELAADDRIGSGASISPAGVGTLYWRIDGGTTGTDGDGFKSVHVTDGKHTIEYWADDVAGNTDSSHSKDVWIDTGNPSSTHSLSGTLGDDGWYVSSVTVDFSASDDLSGVDFVEYAVDGGSTTKGSSVTVSSDGSHTVQHSAVDVAGNQENPESVSFDVDTTAPSPSFTYSPATPNVSETVSFDASGSSDATSGIASYEWDFDGDGATDATGRTPSHTYASSGDYTVTLTVTDNAGNVDSTSTTVTVVNPPTASFSYSPNSPSTGESITFDGSDSDDPDGSIGSHEWDLDGDGTIDATGETVTHSYGSGGDYDVTLTVTGNDGATDSVTKTVTVAATGSISGQVTDTGGDPVGGATITVANASTGDTVATTTTASDGTYGVSEVPVGEYNVTAEKEGYSTGRASVTVQDGLTTEANIVVEQTDLLDQQWTHSTPGRTQYSEPAVGTERVFVGGLDDTVYALDRTDGSVDWSFDRDGSLSDSSPELAGGTVYVGGGGGTVYALDAASGSVDWRASTDSAVVSSPTVSGGVVYVGSNDGDVLALDASSGSRSWTTDVGAAVLSEPAVDSGTVYVTTDGGAVVALDAASGSVSWRFDTGTELGHSSPIVADGRVYVAADRVYALDPSDGSQLWTGSYGGTAGSTPAYDSGKVFVGSADGEVYAFDATTGSVDWTASTGDAVGSNPAVVGSRLVVGSTDGRIYVFNASTGTELASTGVGSPVRSSPVVASDVVYVGSRGGTVSALANVTSG